MSVPSCVDRVLQVALIVIVMNIVEIPSVIGTIVANALGFEEAVSEGMGLFREPSLRVWRLYLKARICFNALTFTQWG